MTKGPAIEFVLRDEHGGVELTPTNISLARFNEFNLQVERFLAGTRGKAEIANVAVKVEAGSYLLKTVLPATLMQSLEPDLAKLQSREDCLADIDPNRAEVLTEWQAASRKSPRLQFVIRPRGLASSKTIKLSNKTDYRAARSPWVKVEKCLMGVITAIGGATRPNVHVRLDDTNEIVTVASDQQYLKQQTANLVYQRALLRVEAEENVTTGAVREYRLIAFEPYAPRFDEAALDRFTSAGRTAWADVPDAAEWVRELRGRK